MKLPL